MVFCITLKKLILVLLSVASCHSVILVSVAKSNLTACYGKGRLVPGCRTGQDSMSGYGSFEYVKSGSTTVSLKLTLRMDVLCDSS